jgi:murein L,D-transpeptidase YafK
MAAIAIGLITATTSCRQPAQTSAQASGQQLTNKPSVPSGTRDMRPQTAPLQLPVNKPHIVVRKGERKLELYSDKVLVRAYKAGLGLNPVADKKQEGDYCTPEGDFYIFTKNNKSAYYLSLGLSYPNAEDAERGVNDGLITKRQHDAILDAIRRKSMPPQNTKLGGEIYIHGHGAGSDWTWGCVALENEDVRELYDAVSVGTPVTILP